MFVDAMVDGCLLDERKSMRWLMVATSSVMNKPTSLLGDGQLRHELQKRPQPILEARARDHVDERLILMSNLWSLSSLYLIIASIVYHQHHHQPSK